MFDASQLGQGAHYCVLPLLLRKERRDDKCLWLWRPQPLGTNGAILLGIYGYVTIIYFHGIHLGMFLNKIYSIETYPRAPQSVPTKPA